MEDEAVDAGVIPPNSPLYRYLSEAGYGHAELYDTDESTSHEGTLRTVHTKLPIHIRIATTAITFAYNVTLWSSKSWDALLNSVYGTDSTGSLSAILNSPMLLEDDHHFLENLLNTQYRSGASQNEIGSIVLVVMSAVFVFMISRWLMSASWNLLDYTLAMLLCLLALWLLLSKLKKHLVMQQERSLLALLALQKEFRSKVKKCLQVIQESEIVARGFTLASRNVPVQRLEMNKLMPSLDPNRQCPELRHSVFHWTREMFLFWQSMTWSLMKSIPLMGELDASLLYLACTEPRELSKELFSENEEELYVGTDFYSLSALKSMLYLLDVQQSEFLRRLALSMAPNIMKAREHCAYVLKNAVDNSKEVSQVYLNKVTNAYQLYKSYCKIQERSATSTSRPSLPDQDFHVAVHSLALHLQAALKRVEAVENICESFDKEEQNDDLNSRISCLLVEVQAEITSAAACAQDVTHYIEKREEFEEEVAESGVQPGLLPAASGDVQQVVTIEEGDKPEIVDEVFEALLTEKPEPPHPDWDDDDDFMTVPNQTRAKQKEASAVVLKELRTVLVVKAKEHQEREKKALARSGVEGEHFEKLGFVVPESEQEEVAVAHNVDGSPGLHMHQDSKHIMEFSSVKLTTNADVAFEEHLKNENFPVVDEPIPHPVSPVKTVRDYPISLVAHGTTFALDSTIQEISSAPVKEDNDETRDRSRNVEAASLPVPSERFSLPHLTNVAQMAANKSKFFSPLHVCTFTDSTSYSSSEEEDKSDK